MNSLQRELVAEAVQVYQESIRSAIVESTAFWPLGLPRWDAPWIALGLRGPQVSHLTVWRRWPESGASAGQITLAVPHCRGVQVTAQLLYPRHAGAEVSWNAVPGTVTVTLPRVPSACVLRLA
jgi:alpha-galactosidase